MKQSDIDDLIENHYGGYDGSRFKITPPTAYYKDGEKVTKKVITENISFSQSTFEIASEETYQAIIAALAKIINSPDKPLLKDDKAISKHFHKYFPRVTGLSDSLLTKILAKGKPILKEREMAKDLTDDYLVRYLSKKLELQDK